ncbi:hypothetical protein E1212_14695 [Jiangella ureilytica]|uniref:Uncharacterized protein n=1 Tax=Jiangella ureilytica TaxID=2530374 RepID=A0A4R4RMF9_9ACTN|nr:DUF6113 family protein [Jiangella ureilytica]TDC50614.1 hypothetical protein E1212_14695 [Jiangella ureilytica]
MTVAPGAAPSVTPAGRAAGPSWRSRMLSALAVTALGAVTVVVAVCGSFVHRWANPFGMFLAIGGAVGVAILARVVAHSRLGLGVIALLWLAPVIVISESLAGTEGVIMNDEFGLIFLVGGTIGLAIVLGMGVEARSARRVT